MLRKLYLLLRYYLLRYRLWKFNQDFDKDNITLTTILMMITINDLVLLAESTPFITKQTELTSRFISASEVLHWLDLIIEEIQQLRYVTNNQNIMYVLKNDYTLRLSAFMYHGERIIHPDELQYELFVRLDTLQSLIDNVSTAVYQNYLNRIITPLIRELVTIQEALLYVALNYEKTKSHHV